MAKRSRWRRSRSRRRARRRPASIVVSESLITEETQAISSTQADAGRVSRIRGYELKQGIPEEKYKTVVPEQWLRKMPATELSDSSEPDPSQPGTGIEDRENIPETGILTRAVRVVRRIIRRVIDLLLNLFSKSN